MSKLAVSPALANTAMSATLSDEEMAAKLFSDVAATVRATPSKRYAENYLRCTAFCLLS